MERRQSFRFRLPWQSGAPAPRPTVEPRPPSQPTSRTAGSQPPTTGTTPAQRPPPFRPPGSAAQRTEPQTSAPSRPGAQPRVTPQPASPSRAAARSGTETVPPPASRTTRRTRPAPQPSSPSRGASQTQPASQTAAQPESPPGLASQPSAQSSSPPSSPSLQAAEMQPTAENPQPRSPPRPLQPTTPEGSQLPPSSGEAPPSSPSRGASQTQPSLETAAPPQSPLRLASQPGGQSSSPPSSPSPSLQSSQPQPTAASPEPQSPLRQLQPKIPASSQLPPSSSEPSPLATQQEQLPAVPQPQSQVPQTDTKFISESVKDQQNQTANLTSTAESSDVSPSSSEPSPLATQQEPLPAMPQPQLQVPRPKAEIIPEGEEDHQKQTKLTSARQSSVVSQTIEAATPQPPTPTRKLDASLAGDSPKTAPDLDGKAEENQDGNEEIRGLREKRKTTGPTDKESNQRTVFPNKSDSTSPKVEKSVVPQAEHMKWDKHENLGSKERLDTSDRRKHVRPAISHPVDKNTVRESNQKASVFGEGAPLQKEIRDNISKFVHKMTAGNPKHPMDSQPVTVITLAGENRGASMQLGTESTQKEGAVHIHRGYKINPDECPEGTADGEGSSKTRSPKESETKEDQPKAYVNSNIQGMNNSIMFSGSINQRDPGVHLVISHNQRETMKSNDQTESLKTHKAEFNVTPAEKLTYEPNVKRRCLRGLFMESSDSDPDNPEKPRRHGCRYRCRKRSEDNNIDVL